MTNLSQKKNCEASDGDIIESENDVGNESERHSELERVVMRESLECIEQTKKDATNLDKSQKVVARSGEAKDKNGTINPKPNCRPGAGKTCKKFCHCGVDLVADCGFDIYILL